MDYDNDFSGAPQGLKRSPGGTPLSGHEKLLSEYPPGCQQPPINTRLNQMRIFLMDTDVYRDPDFKPKLEQCRKYIRDLKLGNQAGEDYNVNMVMLLELKIATHDRWIKDKEKLAEVDFDDVYEYERVESQGRLMPKTWQPEEGEVEKETAGVAISEAAGWPLEEPEAKIHVADGDDVDIDPQLADSVNNGDSFRPDVHDPWHYTKAVEQANRDIAAYAITQYREADKTWNEKGEEISPFAWNHMPTNFLQPFAPPSAEHLLSSWYETYSKLADLMESLHHANMVAPRPLLTAICNTFIDKRDQLLLEEQKAVTGPNKGPIANRYLCVKDFNTQECEDLKIFTYEAKYQRIDTRLTSFRGSELTFVQAVEALRDNYLDFWPQKPNAVMPAAHLIRKSKTISRQTQLPVLTDERREQMLLTMGDQNRIRTFLMNNEHGQPTRILGVGRPLPNDFPEVRRGLSKNLDHWVKIAERIYIAYSILKKNLQASNMDPLYMRHTVLPDFSENLRSRVRMWGYKVGQWAVAQKWIELAKPLADWRERDKLDINKARALLIQRLVDEGNAAREHGPSGQRPGARRRGKGGYWGGGGDNGGYGPSTNMVWNWAENRWYTSTGDRFHHRRWDHSVQSEGNASYSLFAHEEAQQVRSDANRGVKSVRFDQRDYIEPELTSPPNPSDVDPAADKWFPQDEAFFPYEETAVVDTVMQDVISEHVPPGRQVDAQEARAAEREASRKRKRQSDINSARNAPRPDQDDNKRQKRNSAGHSATGQAGTGYGMGFQTARGELRQQTSGSAQAQQSAQQQQQQRPRASSEQPSQGESSGILSSAAKIVKDAIRGAGAQRRKAAAEAAQGGTGA